MRNSILILLLCVFGSLMIQAQERLFELHSNAILSHMDPKERQGSSSLRAAGDTLDLPFFDDFSEPFSRLHHPYDLYPNADLWVDRLVYINNHMAINPRSQGVATFDGLDQDGWAYGFGSALPTPSDSLTSKPLKLAGAVDTVYLSFYFQAQGMGNFPELEDSLVVEFKDTAQTWRTVWKTPGYILEDYDFRRAMIPVLGGRYLFDGFQFRFRNYASLSGNTDHWHVDYVKLDEGRTSADTILNDLAIISQTTVDFLGNTFSQTNSVLREYANMPWDHFKTDRAAFMGDTSYFAIRNSAYSTFPSGEHNLRIFDQDGVEIHTGTTSSPDVRANVVCGNLYNNCTVPDITPEGDTIYDLFAKLIGFTLPESPQISEDSAYFMIVNDISGLSDEVPTNDKHAYKQAFYNYYAYDDGTAELAYGLGELEEPGSVALKYDIKVRDTLRAIQIYLNPVAEDLSQEPVNIAVWIGNNEPEELLWMSPTTTLSYSAGINYFYNYPLDTVLDVEGTIFIGWIQQPATDQKFSIGLDRRNNVSEKLFYNLGGGWAQSSIEGALMVRPTFGRDYSYSVGVNEREYASVSVYPNPTTGRLHLMEQYAGQFRNEPIQLFDLTGREVFAASGYDGNIDLGHLRNGTYIFRIGQQHTQRVVLQK